MPDWFFTYLGYALVYQTIVKAFLASTDTPPPDTAWGKVYRGLEWSCMIIGKIKEGS